MYIILNHFKLSNLLSTMKFLMFSSNYYAVKVFLATPYSMAFNPTALATAIGTLVSKEEGIT